MYPSSARRPTSNERTRRGSQARRSAQAAAAGTAPETASALAFQLFVLSRLPSRSGLAGPAAAGNCARVSPFPARPLRARLRPAAPAGAARKLARLPAKGRPGPGPRVLVRVRSRLRRPSTRSLQASKRPGKVVLVATVRGGPKYTRSVALQGYGFAATTERMFSDRPSSASLPNLLAPPPSATVVPAYCHARCQGVWGLRSSAASMLLLGGGPPNPLTPGRSAAGPGSPRLARRAAPRASPPPPRSRTAPPANPCITPLWVCRRALGVTSPRSDLQLAWSSADILRVVAWSWSRIRDA